MSLFICAFLYYPLNTNIHFTLGSIFFNFLKKKKNWLMNHSIKLNL